MKKPEIATLDQKERDTLMRQVGDCNLGGSAKKTVLNTIDFTLDLQEQLKDAKLSIAILKSLFGCKSEVLKKFPLPF